LIEDLNHIVSDVHVCFRWKRNGQKEIVKDVTSSHPVLQFVAIQRRDTKEWAIPGVSKVLFCLRTIHAIVYSVAWHLLES